VNYRLPLDDNTPAEDVMADWAAHNGCAGGRQETQIDTEVRLIEYGSCTNGAQVQLYAVDGGGHTWPGSFDVPSLGYTTHQINATDLLWAFFSAYTLPDVDADLIPDAADNCPVDANFSQVNSDRNFIDNSPPYAAAADDKTLVNSDVFGDACDNDDDNDYLPDAQEVSGGYCSGFVTDPLRLDTDGDRVVDSIECLLGFDPTSGSTEPSAVDCANYITGGSLSADTDGDKIRDYIEFCYHNSSPVLTDTDADRTTDGGSDGCQIASVNGDRIVNSGDQIMLASGISGTQPYIANVDINRDGVLNSGDQLSMASFITPGGQCP
jgi:hypothetical protein